MTSVENSAQGHTLLRKERPFLSFPQPCAARPVLAASFPQAYRSPTKATICKTRAGAYSRRASFLCDSGTTLYTGGRPVYIVAPNVVIFIFSPINPFSYVNRCIQPVFSIK